MRRDEGLALAVWAPFLAVLDPKSAGYFRCTKFAITLSEQACAKRYHSAQGATGDAALSTCAKCKTGRRLFRKHGVAKTRRRRRGSPWDA